MTRPVASIPKQRGAVAIIVGFSIFMLILMIGLVVDLGFLYTRKTELQNAADAAALAGAKELNGTTVGINAAVDKAIALAAANSVDFGGNPVEITAANIFFASTPDGNDTSSPKDGIGDGVWSSVAAAQSAPDDKRFIKVDTGNIAYPTWFMRVAMWGGGGIDSTAANGMAVAGPELVDMAPLATCAIDTADCSPGGTGNCGYQKGKSYKLSEINPIGPGSPYWINPVTTEAGECAGSGSAAATLPYLCQGKVAANVAGSAYVLTNSGVTDAQRAALDSRFDDYDPQGKCDPATAPPDTNIKEFLYDDANVAGWMTPTPRNYVSPTFVDPPKADGKCTPNKGECQASRVTSRLGGVIQTDSGGVIWSFVRPEGNAITGRAVNSPPYPATGTPYTQTSGVYFQAPTHTAVAERRVLTLAIVNCPNAGGNCRPANVLARGRFLMQRKARSSGGDKDIYLEFGGTVGVAGIAAEYKLYR